MALLQCPECGGKVSDRAPVCPHCGFPMADSATTKPVQGKVGLRATSLRCPYCGEMTQAKDILISGWARCPSCKKDFPVNGVNTMFSDDGMIEKIIPFGDTKEAFHRRVMEQMMKTGPEDFFLKVSDINVTRKYIWVREFGYGGNCQIYPMSPYGETFFKALNEDNSIVTSLRVYDKWYPADRMQEFDSSLTAGAEVVDRTYSAKEVKHRYSHCPTTSNFLAKDVYYCLPVFDETFTYEGQSYHFMGIGSGADKTICWESMPEEPHLLSSPDFYTTNAVVYIGTTIALMVLAIYIFDTTDDFWISMVILFFGGGLLGMAIESGLGKILTLPFRIIDIIIQSFVNSSRRKEFIQRFHEIQDRKVYEAKRYHNLDFEYTVPHYPLP